jgi:hypothetical protein
MNQANGQKGKKKRVRSREVGKVTYKIELPYVKAAAAEIRGEEWGDNEARAWLLGEAKEFIERVHLLHAKEVVATVMRMQYRGQKAALSKKTGIQLPWS